MQAGRKVQLFGDAMISGDGDLTETRGDYNVYVRQMDDIASKI